MQQASDDDTIRDLDVDQFRLDFDSQMATNPRNATNFRTDVLAVACSVACAIHCATTPILLAVLPSVTGVRWLANPIFHQLVAVVCAVLVLRAIVPGWRIHRKSVVATLAGVGMCLLVVSAFVLPDACCIQPGTTASQSANVILGGVADFNPPLISPAELASWFGTSAAGQIMEFQPYLTPVGGIFLIFAHILNIWFNTSAAKARYCKKQSCVH